MLFTINATTVYQIACRYTVWLLALNMICEWLSSVCWIIILILNNELFRLFMGSCQLKVIVQLNIPVISIYTWNCYLAFRWFWYHGWSSGFLDFNLFHCWNTLQCRGTLSCNIGISFITAGRFLDRTEGLCIHLPLYWLWWNLSMLSCIHWLWNCGCYCSLLQMWAVSPVFTLWCLDGVGVGYLYLGFDHTWVPSFGNCILYPDWMGW